MTMEMERIRQSFGGRIRPKLQYEDPDDYDDTDCADEFGNGMGLITHESNATTSIVRSRNQAEAAMTTMTMTIQMTLMNTEIEWTGTEDRH